MTNVFNKKELIGQKVNDGRSNGIITELLQHVAYPITVKFETGREDTFTEGGYISRADSLPSLRFGHLDEEDIDYGKPEWIADWDDADQRKYFIEYDHKLKEWRTNCNSWVQISDVKYMSKKEAEEIVQYINMNSIEL